MPSQKPPGTPLKRLKTKRLERRLSLAISGAKAGSSLLATRAGTLWMGREKRDKKRSQALRKQAQQFAAELSKLKGSYVKIGQMLALFGEHILPDELTEALHKLAHSTTPLAWPVVQAVMVAELGERLGELTLETTPIAAASLGQVHRATVIATGEQVCLKVLYPGVRESIDSDFNDVIRLLKMARWLETGKELNEWLEEIRSLLHEEVDYVTEAQKTRDMRALVAEDDRFVIPAVYERYSTTSVLTLEYLSGHTVNEETVLCLPQPRRNHLASCMLELFFREVFEWGALQTDPNFGNYKIRLAEENDKGIDQLVLLDFGAVRHYDESFLGPLKHIILAAHHNHIQGVVDGLQQLGCIQETDPESAKLDFARFCMSLLEPLRDSFDGVPDYALNASGEYRWRESRLVKRVGKQAAKSAVSRYFTLPPKEFSLVVRKLIGVFSFISVIGGEFNGYPLIEKYAQDNSR